MATPELGKKAATKADVAALAVALKEIAALLDREIAAFRGVRDTHLEELRSTNAQALESQLAENSQALSKLSAQLTAKQTAEQKRIQGEFRSAVSAVSDQLKAGQAAERERMGAEFDCAVSKLEGQKQTMLGQIRFLKIALIVNLGVSALALTFAVVAVLTGL